MTSAGQGRGCFPDGRIQSLLEKEDHNQSETAEPNRPAKHDVLAHRCPREWTQRRSGNKTQKENDMEDPALPRS